MQDCLKLNLNYFWSFLEQKADRMHLKQTLCVLVTSYILLTMG